MFDIGWAELFLIAVVALVVLGPNELPVVMRKLGRWAGALRRHAASWQAQIENLTDEPPSTKPEPQKPDVKKTNDEGTPHD